MTLGTLRVRSTRLGRAFDLLAAYGGPVGFFFERGGLGIATSRPHGGMGASIGSADPEGLGLLSRRTVELLRSLARGEGEGPGAIAVGVLPFDRLEPASMRIYGRTVVRLWEGETYLIDLVGEDEGPAPFEPRVGVSAPHEAFAEIQLRPIPPPDEYVRSVATAVQRISTGPLRKVVLARALDVEAGRELDPRQLLARLRAVDPGCFAFAASEGSRPSGPTLVGASPELLVARHGREVEARPLAGSAPRFGDPEEDEASRSSLLSSDKDREEHAAVVEAVSAAMEPFCDELAFDALPRTVGTANVWHLATGFHGVLREPRASALELVAALHPTPAVCGTPLDAALATIRELERISRGCYAGPVGWMDADGNGEWAIALRCAELSGSTARLFAGAGIVAGSVPELELDETERKFRALLDSLRWG